MTPFNKNITGYKNENEFVNYLNGKKISEMNPMFAEFLETLFGKLNGNNVIHAWNNYQKQKTDIYIEIKNKRKSISIKKGIKNSVHAEHIKKFVQFLKENNLSDVLINQFLKYHYGDGTADGCGNKRISSAEYKIEHQAEIDCINQKLNNDDCFIKKAVNKFILKGNTNIESIDCIIYGIVEDFIWITKDEIINFLLSKKDEYSTGIHISHLTIQPMNRCLNKNPRYEKNRHYIQAKWYNISDDIIEVMVNRNNSMVEPYPSYVKK